MREIIFRGKRIDNGEWVYGSYICRKNAENAEIYWESEPDYDGRYADDIYQVIPKTVGQYTGLEANRQKIFEGDIVKIQVTNDQYINLEVSFFEGKFVLINKHLQQWKHFRCELSTSLKPKIIGNIHDNPELLEDE